ncbi:MAG: glycosyltransferase [Paludibacteraceae bacterium]|nr:glycosyltransferase [Paludibacteraceae bacterium]
MESQRINNVIAVVVWYNPTEQEVETIKLYCKDVLRVIVVDNSNSNHAKLISSIPNAVYIPLLTNYGIAYALNRGCEHALQLGAEWVLTMDQDSQWKQHSVHEYIQEASLYQQIEQVGIFSPFHDCVGEHKRHTKIRFEPRLTVMCSGNLLRLKAWQDANGFREDFFIDLVDDEMNCHLHQLNWKIIRLNYIFLNHHLGRGAHNLLFTKHTYTPHPAWRYYYIGRNLQRVIQLYPMYQSYYNHHVWKVLKRLCLYDWSNKWNKLHNYIKGWREGKLPYTK